MKDNIQNLSDFKNSINQLLKGISRKSNKQINASDEKDSIQAHMYSWFNNFRIELIKNVNGDILNTIDDQCNEILKLTIGFPSRNKVVIKIKNLIKELNNLLTSRELLIDNNKAIIPDFSIKIKDPRIEQLLINRWNECEICVANEAKFASLVMIGGLLEALLLSKINDYPDKSKIFTAASTPKDKNGKSLYLKEWTLKNYIEVSHELKLITSSIKDLSIVLRDYRNYIHPYKEISIDSDFTVTDIKIIWDIAKKIINEII